MGFFLLLTVQGHFEVIRSISDFRQGYILKTAGRRAKLVECALILMSESDVFFQRCRLTFTWSYQRPICLYAVFGPMLSKTKTIAEAKKRW